MLIEHYRNTGTKCHIEEGVIPVIENMLKEFKPKLIIELGTAFGGLVEYLTEWFPNTPIYTVDAFWYISKETAARFRENNVHVLITSRLFDGEITIPMLCSLPIKKFLFCDNGNKDLEVRMFSGYLRPGDLLGMHDWTDYKDRLLQADFKFSEFESHPVNKRFKENNPKSVCRFWYRKEYSTARVKPVNDTEDLWKPGL